MKKSASINSRQADGEIYQGGQDTAGNTKRVTSVTKVRKKKAREWEKKRHTIRSGVTPTKDGAEDA